MNKLAIAIVCYLVGQIIVWFTTNAQFLSKWAADHPWFMSLVISGPTTYLFLIGTKYSAEYFDGMLWPGRFIGFGLGMIAFASLTYFIMNEGMNMKTIISMALATILVAVQIFWK
jgi:hypothetical protein